MARAARCAAARAESTVERRATCPCATWWCSGSRTSTTAEQAGHDRRPSCGPCPRPSPRSVATRSGATPGWSRATGVRGGGRLRHDRRLLHLPRTPRPPAVIATHRAAGHVRARVARSSSLDGGGRSLPVLVEAISRRGAGWSARPGGLEVVEADLAVVVGGVQIGELVREPWPDRPRSRGASSSSSSPPARPAPLACSSLALCLACLSRSRWSFPKVVRRRDTSAQTTRTFWASSPLRPGPTSNSTCCPARASGSRRPGCWRSGRRRRPRRRGR